MYPLQGRREQDDVVQEVPHRQRKSGPWILDNQAVRPTWQSVPWLQPMPLLQRAHVVREDQRPLEPRRAEPALHEP